MAERERLCDPPLVPVPYSFSGRLVSPPPPPDVSVRLLETAEEAAAVDCGHVVGHDRLEVSNQRGVTAAYSSFVVSTETPACLSYLNQELTALNDAPEISHGTRIALNLFPII